MSSKASRKAKQARLKHKRKSDRFSSDSAQQVDKQQKVDNNKNNAVHANDSSGNDLSILSAEPEQILQWLLAPISVQTFFKTYWEKKPLHIKRKHPNYYQNLFSKQQFDQYCKRNDSKTKKNSKTLEYGADLNVCIFEDGVKIDKNPKENKIVDSAAVQKLFNEGCTLQVLHPQHYSHSIQLLLTQLESYFTCLAGSNCYITPPNSQGLAPHNDDVDVFILQLEGRKQWRLYEPLQELALQHSGDLSHDEIGSPTHNLTLEAGDFLYFPRGVIHEACCTESFSSHLTVSCMQNHNLGSFLGLLMNRALEAALHSDMEYREGLPPGLFDFAGTQAEQLHMSLQQKNGKSESESESESSSSEGPPKEAADNAEESATPTDLFAEKLHYLMNKLMDHADVHGAVDIFSRDFLLNRLPPVEVLKHNNSIEKNYNFSSETEPHLITPVPLQPHQSIRLRYPRSTRMQIIPAGEQDGEEEEEEAANEAGSNGSYEQMNREGEYSTEESSNEKEEESAQEIELSGDEEEDDDEDESESEGEEEGYVLLFNSLHNNPAHHLDGRFPPAQSNSIKLPLYMATALLQLFSNYPKYTAIKDLKLDIDESEDHNQAAVNLAMSLWAVHLIQTQQPAKQTNKDNATSNPNKGKSTGKAQAIHQKAKSASHKSS
jgi:ribosomal protein L16 Arg81 hydroxylase